MRIAVVAAPPRAEEESGGMEVIKDWEYITIDQY